MNLRLTVIDVESERSSPDDESEQNRFETPRPTQGKLIRSSALGNAEDGDTDLQPINNSLHGRRLAGPDDPFDDHNSARCYKRAVSCRADDGLPHALLQRNFFRFGPSATSGDIGFSAAIGGERISLACRLMNTRRS